MTTPLAQSFADEATGYVGTAYQHQARLPGVGLDCAGVAVCAARAVGVEIEDPIGYGRLPNGDDLTRAIDAHCVRVALSEIEVGDIVAFAWTEEPQHVAVVVSTAPFVEIVHAHIRARKVVRHRLDDQWRARARLAFRLRGF